MTRSWSTLLRQRAKRATVLLALTVIANLLWSQNTAAYQFFQVKSGTAWLVVKWRTIPVNFTVDNGPTNILAEMQTAVNTWNNVATAQNVIGTLTLATTTDASGATVPLNYTGANFGTATGWGNLTADGRYEVVFDEDGTAFAAVGLDPASVNGLGRTRREVVGGQGAITDAFLLLNGTRTDFDRQSTEVHEFGHIQGLAHSSVGMYNSGSAPSDALFPVPVGSVPTMHPFSVAGTARRTLEPDDIAGISELYPEASFSTTFGSISGTVTRCFTDEVVEGVNVRAVSASSTSVQVSRYTAFNGNTTGTFVINGLPAGSYRVVIEGMGQNGFTAGRMAIVSTVNADFPTEHLNPPDEAGCVEDNPDLPVNVAVTAGGTVASSNFKVSQVQLAFVVDDTGSMGPEITQVKNALSRTVTRLQSGATATRPFPRTAIITFKDNVTKRIVSNDPAKLQTSISGLVASGGGDCPEMSNAALLVAARLLEKGGDALLFTDADSRSDGPNRATVNAAYREKSLRLSTLLSGTCSGSLDTAADLSAQMDPALSSNDAAGTSDPARADANESTQPSERDEFAPLPTLGVEGAVRTYSEISSETGGLFTAIPEVKTSSADAKTRYANVATNVAVSSVIPAVALVEPGRAPQGATMRVEIVGSNTNFSNISVATVAGTGVTVASKTLVSPTRMFVDLSITASAETGFRDVTVTTDLGAGTTETALGGGSLQVTTPPTTATIVSIAPTEVAQGKTVDVTISGLITSFASSSTVSLGSGVTINSITVSSATSLRANITVSATATIGFRDVRVTTGSEIATESVTGPLLVTAPPPVVARVTAVNPGSGERGRRPSVTIVGENTNFAAGVSTVAFSGTGITVDSVTVSSPTSLLAAITISPTATLGFRDVTVTTGSESAVLLNGFNVADSGLPTMSLTPSTVNFGVVNNGGTLGFATPAQSLSLTQSGTGTVTWTAAPNQSWITVSPASGSGAGTITVTINNTGGVLPATGALNGTVTVNTGGTAVNSPAATVNLTVLGAADAAAPVGAFDTPTNGQTGITGSIAVTGWVVDDIGLSAVRIFRDPVAGEGSQAFIGNAVFVRGARPDIAAFSPTKPFYDQAGWGYLMLTNFLPNQGNGTFTLYAYADDLDGHTTLLGTKTITCANATATAPFGALDTPTQGGTVSGSFVNFGWALAGQPASSGRSIPTDGSTVLVYVDSALLGTVDSYNNARSDIQALFPGYANTNGAIGVKTINSSTLANGAHTIFWIVTDNLGAAQGIGSRFFTVSNSSLFAASRTAMRADAGSTDPASAGSDAVAQGSSPASPVIDARPRIHGDAAAVERLSSSRAAVAVTRGFDAGALPELATPDADGIRHVRTAQLERIVVALDPGHEEGATYRGYSIAGDTLRDLPVGSHLDARTGEFAWAPGLAFGGRHDLVFVKTGAHGSEQIKVRVDIDAQSAAAGDPRLVIDIPGAGATLAQPFTLAGWAIDPNGPANGSGIDTLHVWAYPVGGAAFAPGASGGATAPKGDPRWVGVAAYGGLRLDVADLFGPRFARSGFGITVAGLPSGAYDIVVYAHSIAGGRFTVARTVRVTIQ